MLCSEMSDTFWPLLPGIVYTNVYFWGTGIVTSVLTPFYQLSGKSDTCCLTFIKCLCCWIQAFILLANTTGNKKPNKPYREQRNLQQKAAPPGEPCTHKPWAYSTSGFTWFCATVTSSDPYTQQQWGQCSFFKRLQTYLCSFPNFQNLCTVH